jgi:hypothetical protein
MGWAPGLRRMHTILEGMVLLRVVCLWAVVLAGGQWHGPCLAARLPCLLCGPTVVRERWSTLRRTPATVGHTEIEPIRRHQPRHRLPKGNAAGGMIGSFMPQLGPTLLGAQLTHRLSSPRARSGVGDRAVRTTGLPCALRGLEGDGYSVLYFGRRWRGDDVLGLHGPGRRRAWAACRA